MPDYRVAREPARSHDLGWDSGCHCSDRVDLADASDLSGSRNVGGWSEVALAPIVEHGLGGHQGRLAHG